MKSDNPANSEKVLCICDDFYHPGSLIKEGLSFLREEGYFINFIDDMGAVPCEILNQYNILILSKANMTAEDKETPWLNEDWEQAFYQYVERGGFFLVIHSGTAGYENRGKMVKLMGGSFLDHPEQCTVTYSPQVDFPVTGGIEAFSSIDEHYFMKLDNSDLQVFLISSSHHGTQPAGWVCRSKAGDVTVLTPGHRIEVWKNNHFKILLKNILRSAGKK